MIASEVAERRKSASKWKMANSTEPHTNKGAMELQNGISNPSSGKPSPIKVKTPDGGVGVSWRQSGEYWWIQKSAMG